jgi:hypothetical protein
MIDDPNLHRCDYGYLISMNLRNRAEKRRYHFSLATIPLMLSTLIGKPLALFRDYTEQLSLLIHGNNHTGPELAEFASESDCFDHCTGPSQDYAIERRTGIRVSRIMVAPTCACSGRTFHCMHALWV